MNDKPNKSSEIHLPFVPLTHEEFEALLYSSPNSHLLFRCHCCGEDATQMHGDVHVCVPCKRSLENFDFWLVHNEPLAITEIDPQAHKPAILGSLNLCGGCGHTPGGNKCGPCRSSINALNLYNAAEDLRGRILGAFSTWLSLLFVLGGLSILWSSFGAEALSWWSGGGWR